MVNIGFAIAAVIIGFSLISTNLLAEPRLACDDSREYKLSFKYGDPLAEGPVSRSERCCIDKISILEPGEETAAIRYYAKKYVQYLKTRGNFGGRDNKDKATKPTP